MIHRWTRDLTSLVSRPRRLPEFGVVHYEDSVDRLLFRFEISRLLTSLLILVESPLTAWSEVSHDFEGER